MSNDCRSLHFRGAIFINGVMPLIEAPAKSSTRDYIGILETAGVPKLPNKGNIFVHDNCPIQRFRVFRDWKRENSVQEYSWPAHSPYLNPIENGEGYTKRQLQCMVLDHENLGSCEGYMEQISHRMATKIVPANT